MSHTLTKHKSKKSLTITAHREGGQWTTKKLGNGVVNFHIHGPTGKIKAKAFASQKLIQLIQAGLPIQELTDLQASLAGPTERLAPMLGISKATLHRLRGAGEKLGPAESDRLVRFARLLGKAIQALGDLQDAKQWLSSPQFGLGGAVPLDYAKTEVGAREVENLLGRIQYGVYS